MRKITLLGVLLIASLSLTAQSVSVSPTVTCRSGVYAQPYTVAKNSHSTQGSYSSFDVTITAKVTPGTDYCNGYPQQRRLGITRVYISSDPYWQSYDALLASKTVEGNGQETKYSTSTSRRRIYDTTLRNGYFQDKVYLIATTQECIPMYPGNTICSCEPEQLIGVVQELNIIDNALNEIALDVWNMPNRSGYQYYMFEVDNIGTVYGNVSYTWDLRIFNNQGWTVYTHSGSGSLNKIGSKQHSGYVNLPQVGGGTYFAQLTVYPSLDQNGQNNRVITYYSN